MKLGSTVKLIYTGTLEDGTVFGYAKERAPMEFQTGMDLTIPGFEKAVLEMEEGEKKTFTVSMYDAYGEYLDDFYRIIPVEMAPATRLEVGKRINVFGDEGEPTVVTIVSIEDGKLKYDMNHPLAGHDLTFEVEILSVEEPPEGWEPPKSHDPNEYIAQLGM